jgi:hypothetical protein
MQFQNGGEYDFSDEKLQDTFEFLFRTVGLFSITTQGSISSFRKRSVSQSTSLAKVQNQASTKNIGPTWRGLLSGTS